MSASSILIVDDEDDIRELVSGILEDEGYTTRKARSTEEALELIESRKPQLVFLDIWLQGSKMDGLQLLDILVENHPELPIVMISGHGNIETAVTAIKKGAYDFIEKPFKSDRLILVAQRALEASKLKREIKQLKSKPVQNHVMIGHSVIMQQLRQQVERVASTNARVLVTGPMGSGKEVLARALHEASARAQGPFIVINAAAITPEKMEEALFGIEANADHKRRIGALEEANNGTLFIDEIADMPRETQNRILRVLVDQNFQRVGGSKRIYVDVRIISSTNRDLASEIAAGNFREDLFHRLSVVPLRVPSLAERREDIPELVTHFMKQFAQVSGLPMRSLAPETAAILQAHDWPGNVRQLRNNVERVLILAGDSQEDEIAADFLPHDIGRIVPQTATGGGERLLSLALREAREMFEKDYLEAQISRFGGNISKTAEFVGMERSALHRKLKSLGL